MGQCCRKTQSENRDTDPPQIKQNKNVDDKRMLKIGIEVLRNVVFKLGTIVEL